MNIRKRAFLYLARNRKKAILLLAILTFITVLALLCVSVGNAANAALRELREKMGGYFKIEADYTQGKFGRIDDALAKKVTDAGGIHAINGMDIQYFRVEDLELEPGRFTSEVSSKAKLARFLGNTDSGLNEYFLLGYYSIVQGRHITNDDAGQALISDALAERNGLSVGDTFSVRFDEGNLPDEWKRRLKSHTLTVAGIYHIDSPQGQRDADTAECDIEENFIFTDTAFVREVYGEASGHEIDTYTLGLAFFVENPRELDAILNGVLSWEDYDWDGYEVTKNNKTYENSAVPLERLAGLVGVMVLVIVIVSAVMLSLILFLWMRERVHETGIYLSIGIQKTKIACQQILENLAVAAAAFFLAWGICAAASGLAENVIADLLMESGGYELSSGAKKEEEGGISIHTGGRKSLLK